MIRAHDLGQTPRVYYKNCDRLNDVSLSILNYLPIPLILLALVGANSSDALTAGRRLYLIQNLFGAALVRRESCPSSRLRVGSQRRRDDETPIE